jgi:hypothetical protein
VVGSSAKKNGHRLPHGDADHLPSTPAALVERLPLRLRLSTRSTNSSLRSRDLATRCHPGTINQRGYAQSARATVPASSFLAESHLKESDRRADQVVPALVAGEKQTSCDVEEG